MYQISPAEWIDARKKYIARLMAEREKRIADAKSDKRIAELKKLGIEQQKPDWLPKPEKRESLGLSPWPSDNAFELSWPEGDPSWSWLNAVYAVDAREDTEPFLTLLAPYVPANAMPFVRDLLERKWGPLKHKEGPKKPFWKDIPLMDRAAMMMADLIDREEELTVEQAAEWVLGENSAFDKIELQALIDHYNKHGGRWKKRRRPPLSGQATKAQRQTE